MAISLSPLQARKLRLRAQHLHARSESGVDEVVLGLCGVQAQDAQAAVLAVRARAGGTAADVDGRAAGTWSLRRAKGGASIVVNPFEALSGLTEENIDREAADIGRFLGMEADVKIEGGNSIPGGIGGRH